MEQQLRRLQEEALQTIATADQRTLLTVRHTYLGKKGKLSQFTSRFPELREDERRVIGPIVNAVKIAITEALHDRERMLSAAPSEELDVTIPGIPPHRGSLHPLTRIIREAKQIFASLGFVAVDGPEVELDEYNFQKLNLHKDHPARDAQDTYYITEEALLRTHTSPMQIRYMETHKPPLRALFPGRVYRRDQIDATHLPSFFQLEGLLVDEQTSMSDLIGVLHHFTQRMFGQERRIRVYGHYFPYTEPSIEVEMQDEHGEWLEILGAGMVHPQVLRNVHIDPKQFRGWAFGMGPERLAMLKWGIGDIRSFYTGDLRFLEQFR